MLPLLASCLLAFQPPTQLEQDADHLEAGVVLTSIGGVIGAAGLVTAVAGGVAVRTTPSLAGVVAGVTTATFAFSAALLIPGALLLDKAVRARRSLRKQGEELREPSFSIRPGGLTLQF